MRRPHFTFPSRSVVVLALAVSCVREVKPPFSANSAARMLVPGPTDVGGGDGGPFRVTFASPEGETTVTPEVTIVFSSPVRALELAGQDQAIPATIVRRSDGRVPPGEWRWVGTRSIVFAPNPPLSRSSEFEVTIPKEMKALDGAPLGENHVFRFQTPQLHVVRTEPNDGFDHATPASFLQVYFNQPVDLKEVERASSLWVGEEGAALSVPFSASWVPRSETDPRPASHAAVILRPRSHLPVASRFEWKLDASLTGVEGPAPLGSPYTVTARTYGPLTMSEWGCDRSTPSGQCSSTAGIRVQFSNPVLTRDAKTHLRFEPPVAIDWGEPDSRIDRLWLSANLRPSRAYRVVLTAGIKDVFGQKLDTDQSFNFETSELWPRAELGVNGTVLEAEARDRARGSRDISVTSVNLAEYELLTVALDEQGVSRWQNAPNELDLVKLFDYARAFHGAVARVVRPNAPLNTDAVERVSLAQVLAAGNGRGSLLVGIRYRDGQGETRVSQKLITVSDLAMGAKLSPFGSVVWVNRLSTGAPVANATVALRNKDGAEVAAVRTNADGVAMFPADHFVPGTDRNGRLEDPSIFFARTEDDWTFQRVETASSGSYGLYADLSPTVRPLGFLFTDRGIYRPGDTVHLKGIFRRSVRTGTETPQGLEVSVTAADATADPFFEKRATLDNFGEISMDIPIPATVHVGGCDLQAKFPSDAPTGDANDSDAMQAIRTSVMIGEFKPSEFTVNVEADRSAYIRGDKAAINVRGDYLFGAPMEGSGVRVTASRWPAPFKPSGTDGWATEDDPYSRDLPDLNERAEPLQSGEGTTDPHGEYKMSLPLPLPNQRGAEWVSVEAEVEDATRQTVAGSASMLVHPAEFYASVKNLSEAIVAKGALVEAHVGAVEPDGKLRSGVLLKVDLIRRRWTSVVAAGGAAGARYESKVVDAPAGSCVVKSGQQPVTCAFRVNEAGYFILRVTGKDPRGNKTASSTAFYGTGEGPRIGWKMSELSEVELVPDRDVYQIGQTATILVKNPYPEADAWVTVERAGVYNVQHLRLVGPMPTVTVPITDAMFPNAYVAVHVVRGRTQPMPAKGRDMGAPTYRVGYANLSIDTKSRRLNVVVTPSRKELRPGEELDVDLAVSDFQGKPVRAEVTFTAVDEGVLALTGTNTPDPLSVFGAARPLQVATMEGRSDLAKLFRARISSEGLDKGEPGGGGGGDSSMRTDFRATAHFAPSLVTGPDGKQHVKFRLPDGLTTYRLMAVAAAEDDRFGSGDAQVVTSRPLMVRPALPRFLRAGDVFEASAIVTSKAITATSVEVAFSAEGGRVKGSPSQPVSLAPHGHAEVRWTVEAPDVGKLKLAFRAQGGGERDAVEIVRNVQVPMTLESVALSGETTTTAEEKVGAIDAMRDDVGGLDVKVSSTALVGLGSGATQLLEYPYGCTEQLTSKLLPLLPLRALSRDYNVALPANIDAVVDATIGKILANQQSDGGFGYWNSSAGSDPWLTAYVLWTLKLAESGGQHLAPRVVSEAKEYLRRFLEQDGGFLGTRIAHSRATRAYMIDVLVSIGEPDAGYLARVFEDRAELPLFARALLTHAMAVSKGRPQDIAELVRDLENHIRVSSNDAVVVDRMDEDYSPLLDSETRTGAMVLRALLAANPHHPLGSKLARGLIAKRVGGQWRTTHETAWALIAIDEYRRTQESVVPDFDGVVSMNDRVIAKAPFRNRTLLEHVQRIDAKAMFASKAENALLTFQVDGTGKLFYEARLRYAPRTLPGTAIDRGFFVQKMMRAMTAADLPRELRVLPQKNHSAAIAGQLVLVDLLIVASTPREQVVIDDPLPAGLEAIDTQLATATRSLNVDDVNIPSVGSQGYEDSPPEAQEMGSAWYRREIRDDRVLTFVEHMSAGLYRYRYLARATTIGHFVVPPTRAVCMYQPETFGRTAAVPFRVLATRPPP